MWVRLAGELTHLYMNAKDTLSNMPMILELGQFKKNNRSRSLSLTPCFILVVCFTRRTKTTFGKCQLFIKKTHVIFFKTWLFVISLQA